jgi:hypothetical protein
MKPCKECGKEISSGVKKCPSCGKDQRGFFGRHKIITAILVFVFLGGLISMFGKADQSSSTVNAPAPAVKQEQPKAAPIVVTADKLMEDLKGNALNASNTYKGKYVEVTGKLSNIDSNGKYFDIAPMNDQFAIIGVQCYITEDQKVAVAKLSKDQKVTVTGTMTDVGEVLGYSLKVESIK